MFTPGWITTPFPTLAPKRRNRPGLGERKGNNGFRKNSAFVKYQSVRFTKPAPGWKVFELSKRERSTVRRVMAYAGQRKR